MHGQSRLRQFLMGILKVASRTKHNNNRQLIDHPFLVIIPHKVVNNVEKYVRLDQKDMSYTFKRLERY